MSALNHIFEATYVDLDEVVQMVKKYWNHLSQRSRALTEIRNRDYWENVHRTGRLILYKSQDNQLEAFMALIKQDKKAKIDVFFIAPSLHEQEIRLKMLRIAERVAVNWAAEQISWLFYNKEDIDKHFPVFQQLGYVSHCPLNQKGFVILEKKI